MLFLRYDIDSQKVQLYPGVHRVQHCYTSFLIEEVVFKDEKIYFASKRRIKFNRKVNSFPNIFVF